MIFSRLEYLRRVRTQFAKDKTFPVDEIEAEWTKDIRKILGVEEDAPEVLTHLSNAAEGAVAALLATLRRMLGIELAPQKSSLAVKQASLLEGELVVYCVMQALLGDAAMLRLLDITIESLSKSGITHEMPSTLLPK